MVNEKSDLKAANTKHIILEKGDLQVVLKQMKE